MEFDGAKDHSREAADAVGHDGLGDRLRSFADSWDGRREEILEDINTLSERCAVIAETFEQLDGELGAVADVRRDLASAGRSILDDARQVVAPRWSDLTRRLDDVSDAVRGGQWQTVAPRMTGQHDDLQALAELRGIGTRNAGLPSSRTSPRTCATPSWPRSPWEARSAPTSPSRGTASTTTRRTPPR
ncbi:hypothetical protein [Georgenia sp. Marseille-Q6866]